MQHVYLLLQNSVSGTAVAGTSIFSKADCITSPVARMYCVYFVSGRDSCYNMPKSRVNSRCFYAVTK